MKTIYEENLAWFYIAPGHEEDETTRQLVEMALNLMGPEAWAVVQTGESHGEALCEATGLQIVESYRNQAAHPWGISVHLAQTGPRR